MDEENERQKEIREKLESEGLDPDEFEKIRKEVKKDDEMESENDKKSVDKIPF